MRPLRIQIPNQIYHVFNRGNHQQNVFSSDADFQRFLKIVQKYKRKFLIRIYAYVLMPNHFHFLFETLNDDTLARFMQAVTLTYAIYKNRRAETTGHIWQGRYKQTLVSDDPYFLQCARYIELNPVRAGLVAHPADYPWSSYRAHASEVEDPILDNHPLFFSLGASNKNWQEAYQRFVELEM